MKKNAGLWIDHRKAFVVIESGDVEETKEIISNMEKHVRYSGSSHASGADGGQQSTPEDQRDRQFMNHLNRYYDEVVNCIKGAEEILIFGPGEAKKEFEKRLWKKHFNGRIDPVETTDKMTDLQITEKVRLHFKGK